MAVEDINAAGGVNGQKLELQIGDDACDPKQATAVANKMVSDKVVFVAGHFCSGSSIPASDIYKEGKILQITPASTNPKLTDDAAAKGNTTVFRTCGRDDVQGATVGAYILKNNKNAKIAILHDKSPYGKGVADETKKAINKGGLKETMYEAYNDTDKDFTALINKMKQAKIDIIVLGGYHTAAALMIKQAREQGLAAQMMGFDCARDRRVRPAGRRGHRRRADVVPAQGRGRPEECRAGEEVPRRQVQPGGLHAVQLRRRQGVGRRGQQGQVDRRRRGRQRPCAAASTTPPWACSSSTRRATSRTRSTTSTSGRTASRPRPRSSTRFEERARFAGPFFVAIVEVGLRPPYGAKELSCVSSLPDRRLPAGS